MSATIDTEHFKKRLLEERARVHQTPVDVALRRVRGPVDLVFLDPPYADTQSLEHTLKTLGSSSLLAPTSVVVLEQSAVASAPESVGDLKLNKTRRHGRTRISLYGAE